MKRLSPEEQRAARREAQQTRRVGPVRPTKRPSAKARAAAAESQYRRYLNLECGHYGAREDTDELMRSFRPNKDSWWCDVEGKWTTLLQVNIEKIPLPERAPF